jgi:hypothetical protein
MNIAMTERGVSTAKPLKNKVSLLDRALSEQAASPVALMIADVPYRVFENAKR